VALLSFGLWQELGGNPAIIGTNVTLDGRPRTVIGVMPRGFWFPDPSVRIWTPQPLRADSRSWNATLIGRVAPNQDIRAMEAPLSQLTAMLDERFDYPARRDKTKDRRITPVRDDVLGPMQPALLATLAATALILLIGCANVAALVLGQVDARSAEFEVFGAWCGPAATGAAADREVLNGGRRRCLGRRPGMGRLHRRHERAPARCVGRGGARLARVRVGHGHRRGRGVARHPRAHRLPVPK
jgi:hypothetical protein